MPERVYRENEMIGIRKGPNVGKLEQQNFGTLEHWNIRTLEYRIVGMENGNNAARLKDLLMNVSSAQVKKTGRSDHHTSCHAGNNEFGR
jgi:hypothetical protein